MSLRSTLTLLALIFLVSGCGDGARESEETSLPATETDQESATALESSEINNEIAANDWSYMLACEAVQGDKKLFDVCVTDPVIRYRLANSQATRASNQLAEQVEVYGENILEAHLADEVMNKAKRITIDQIAVDLGGFELGMLPKVADYLKFNGGIFGKRTEVGLSAVVVGDGTEVTVLLDDLDEKQQQFLEQICEPELNWKDSICQGEIYAAVRKDGQLVELSLIGAQLASMNRKRLKELQLRKLW